MADAPFTTVVTTTQAVSSAAAGLSGVTAFALRANKINTAWLTASSAIRYQWNAADPTVTTGHLLPANTPLQIMGRKKLLDFRVIRDGAVDSVLTFTLDNTANAGGIQ